MRCVKRKKGMTYGWMTGRFIGVSHATGCPDLAISSAESHSHDLISCACLNIWSIDANVQAARYIAAAFIRSGDMGYLERRQWECERGCQCVNGGASARGCVCKRERERVCVCVIRKTEDKRERERERKRERERERSEQKKDERICMGVETSQRDSCVLRCKWRKQQQQ